MLPHRVSYRRHVNCPQGLALVAHINRLASGHSDRGAKVMPDAQFSVRVTEDRKTVAIVPAPGKRHSRQVELTLEELDTLIGDLGDARSRMVAGQPYPQFEKEKIRVSVATETTWHIEASPPRGALLAFYHPKFGPVGLTLSGEEIAKIVSFLAQRFILQPGPSAERH